MLSLIEAAQNVETFVLHMVACDRQDLVALLPLIDPKYPQSYHGGRMFTEVSSRAMWPAFIRAGWNVNYAPYRNRTIHERRYTAEDAEVFQLILQHTDAASVNVQRSLARGYLVSDQCIQEMILHSGIISAQDICWSVREEHIRSGVPFQPWHQTEVWSYFYANSMQAVYGGKSLLELCLDNEQHVRFLLKRGVDLGVQAGHSRDTILMKAFPVTRIRRLIVRFRIQEVFIKQSNPQQLNLRNRKGMTVLAIACLRQDIGIVKVLLQQGADPDIADARGNTPLHYAVTRSRLDVVSELLRHRANLFVYNRAGENPLSLAVKRSCKHYRVGTSNMVLELVKRMLHKAPLLWLQCVSPGYQCVLNRALEEVKDAQTQGIAVCPGLIELLEQSKSKVMAVVLQTVQRGISLNLPHGALPDDVLFPMDLVDHIVSFL
eukprot:TRINITY_DN716_c0_g1_i1.p1 TRINITY_DN716_c0_g1~~TRINITY_DN716_c0_g1_i1.p1  ORF type:complete len:433 (-),score=81.77 TRINITY_DN716_c0_g1_i1:60-1358(-)